MKKSILLTFAIISITVQCFSQGFVLDSLGYFINEGVHVMAFDDIYPEGHQGGVAIIMHNNRIATNGDIRLEQTPGQWQPVPKQENRKLDFEKNTITASLSYPDTSRHLKGFNPMIYPDIDIKYHVNVQAEGENIVISVDLEKPIPEEFIGQVGFNMELYPARLFGKPWIMDQQTGIFPRQANGPTHTHHQDCNHDYDPIVANNIIATPYAIGSVFTINPDDAENRLSIESVQGKIKLYDGRMNHNNGWFVIRTEIEPGKTKNAIQWILKPNVIKDWQSAPVIQLSQIGYHPNQKKHAVIELDKKTSTYKTVELYKITSDGEQMIDQQSAKIWGNFLRYQYIDYDFTDIKSPGLYKVKYGKSASHTFQINQDIYNNGVWQPVIEYFLPVQMCHMRVNEKYRVWHDRCHMDDAQMAPTNLNHFDGYTQGASTLCDVKSGEQVSGINQGGWHDAGDYDLRIESQSKEAYLLTSIIEEFDIEIDETSICQESKITEIHQPDGKNDIIQQIEHGTLSIIGGYQNLGRLYRGIICNNLRQYVMLGDAASMTDNIPGNKDDRWVFTENNPRRELTTAGHLAAISRVLKSFNDTLSTQSLEIAQKIYQEYPSTDKKIAAAKVFAAAELFKTTKDHQYRNDILAQKAHITEHISDCAWYIVQIEPLLKDQSFSKSVKKALQTYKVSLDEQSKETPYGIPYRPHIWGAGWGIQSMGAKHYFLTKHYPKIFDEDIVYRSLDFVLGCHPGSNTKSFASGVGANSATAAYGVNRGDWSHIPGGVISGTALIRPDFPELLDFPFLWQQTEYVMGGGSTNYMFLVLAANKLLNK